MRCPRCGAALAVGAAVCGRCGNPVAQWGAASAATQPARTQSGLPVTRYGPSPYGPPVHGDRQMIPATLAEGDAETRRVIGYRPVDLPPPLPHRRGGRSRVALVCLVLVAALAAAVALTHGGGAVFGLGASPSSRTGVPPAATTQATTAPACPVRVVDPTASKSLAHPQLTTGLRDAAKKDYRPVDNVSTFSSRQPIYLTFEIVTAKAASAEAIFCAPGMQAVGQLVIPANSARRYAYFVMTPGDANIGQATATIVWNGQVAASLPFTIKQ